MAGTRVATWLAVALLAAVAVPTGLAGGQKSDEAEVLLQAARHKELVAGEVENAIAIYKRILADHAGNRSVAARALVGLGQCYEKLGQQGAREAYERVLRDYADQNEAATEARTRLAALRRSAVPGRPPELSTRRVWGGPGVDTEGSVSADGRWLSFVDWQTGGDLALRDLETGTNRRLTNTAGGEMDWALDSRISPDGRQVAYTWYNSEGLYDLRLIGLDGSGPRVLHTARAKWYVRPAAWSPDGAHVLFVGEYEGAKRIGLVSVADGSVRVLKTLDSRAPNGVSLSPDGRHIVYDLPPQEGTTSADIFLLSIDGKRESTLVQHPANDMSPAWAPDGTWILFASDRTGSLGLWGIPVADGAPRGPAQPVKPEVGERFHPLGFSKDGRFHYGLQVGMADVYVAPFDFQSGKLLAEPKKATERYVGSNTGPEWSPDGRYLAYVSSRGRSWARGSLAVCIRSLDTGEERDLTPELNYYLGPRWSPDGQSILLVGFDRQSRAGLFRMDVESGVVTPLVQSEVDVFPASVEWARGGKAIVYRRQQPGTTAQSIVVHDIESGREEEVYRAPAGSSLQGFALSPDGLQVAFRSFDEAAKVAALKVVPITGGAPRELLRARKDEIPGGAPLGVWSPDGSQILFTRAGTKGERGLWRVPAQGGEAQEVGLSMDSLQDVRVHPDGKRIAFAAGSPAAPEVWVMENIPRPTAVSK